MHTHLTVFIEKKVVKQTANGTETSWQEIEVSDKEYKKYLADGDNYRMPNNDPERCFRALRKPGQMKQDLLDALNDDRLGPSWKKFKKANINASPLGLITARGNNVEDLIKSHEALLYEGLTLEEQEQFKDNLNRYRSSSTQDLDTLIKNYLEMSYYAPCSNHSYAISNGLDVKMLVPERKVVAFERFLQHIQQHPYYGQYPLQKIGFSDDDPENVRAMREAMLTNFIHRYPDIAFSLYDTKHKKYIKETIYKSSI